MSVQQMGRVWNMDLPPNKRLVLLALADKADHEGRDIRPGVPLIAKMTGYSEREVYRIIKELLKERRIAVQEERPGKKTVYYMPQDPCQSVTPDKSSPLTSKTRTPDKCRSRPLTNAAPPPAPPYKEEPSNDPSLNHPIAESPPAPPPRKESVADRFDRFVAIYPRRGSADTNISGARKKHLDKFRNPEQAEAIIAGAKRFRAFAEHTGISGTPTVPMMTTWLNEKRWTNEYAIEMGEVGLIGEKPTQPKADLDYVLLCPTEGAPAQPYEKDKSRPFDAIKWFEDRKLPIHRNWERYCDQQRSEA